MSEHGGSGSSSPGAVPKSAGISWTIYAFIAVALVIIFWQGSNVVRSSGYGRPAPGGDSTKVQLPPPPTT